MATPLLVDAFFPGPLHKHAGGRHSAVLVLATDVSIGSDVYVNGTQGMKPTNWHGTITANFFGAWICDNLDVVHEEERQGPVKDDTGGTEDVSVTVTNSTDTSNPVTVPSVPTVP